jgi:hypothetical protein
LRAVDLHPLWSEDEHGTAAIARVARPSYEALPDKALEYAGDSAGMEVEDLRQRSRRHPGEQADDSQHKPLRAGHPEHLRHLLRAHLERVDNGPEQPHELKDVGQDCCLAMWTRVVRPA